MDADNIVKLGGSGVFASYGLHLVWKWLRREKQENSLYKIEAEAHEATRKELEAERILRKATEMELRAAREEHEKDRNNWFEERDADRKLREELKNEVFNLGNEVKRLRNQLSARGFDDPTS